MATGDIPTDVEKTGGGQTAAEEHEGGLKEVSNPN